MSRTRVRIPLIAAWVRWLFVAAVVTTILIGSVVRPSGVQGVAGSFGTIPSSWLHGLGYAGLAITLAYALQSSSRPDWQILLSVFVLATAYGVGIELLQLTLPYRAFELRDILVNAAGAALAVAGWKVLVRYVRFYRVRRFERPTLR